MTRTVSEKGTARSAPARRPLATRPRAPRPPGRSWEHPTSRFAHMITRAVRPFQRTPPGALARATLRRYRNFRPITVELARGGAELDGFRLALLSDLHVGFYFSEAEFAELAERVSGWSPDLICLAGDL